LVGRHFDAVHRLVESRRQADAEKRDALERLRDGDVDRAAEWYAIRGRVRPIADSNGAL
jgi:hypothetical protein